jgi:hypothetical protein
VGPAINLCVRHVLELPHIRVRVVENPNECSGPGSDAEAVGRIARISDSPGSGRDEKGKNNSLEYNQHGVVIVPSSELEALI